MAMTFTRVLNLSVCASYLVLAVAGLRLAMKKAPKAFHCALWALVAIRLLCPVSIESGMSLIPSREVIPESYLAMEPATRQTPVKLEVVTNPAYPTEAEIDTDTTVARVQIWYLYATLIWLTGMGIMGIYAVYSYLRLRLRVRLALRVQGNVWECDELDSPFILGILRPRIYLPSSLDETIREHVLAHERAHLKRLDHIWKPLGFALLTVHWFNPVMWLGYTLLCRDIELACDEKVIQKLDKPGVRAYSEALVACSASRRYVAACPLAFGEVGVKDRIKSMLRYKKPGFWALLLAVAASIGLAVCFLTDPVPPGATIGRIEQQKGFRITDQMPQRHTFTIYKDQLPEDVLNGQVHEFEENQIIAWQTPGTSVWVKRARMRGDGLALTFDFSYELGESGTVVLPYAVLSPDHNLYVQALDGSVKDAASTYPDACHVFSPGRPFELHMDMEVYQNAAEYVSFDLRGLYHITYVSEDSPLSALIDRPLVIGQVLYASPTESLGYSPEVSPEFTVQPDLTLLSVMDSALGVGYAPCETLEPVELERELFDKRFFPEGWTGSDSAQRLRRGNARAWSSRSQELEYLLLAQKDGSIYLAIVLEQGDVIANLYLLTDGDGQTVQESASATTYVIDASGLHTPCFRLCPDGTFTLSPSPLSSYLGFGVYTRTEDSLILKTSDGQFTWCFQPQEDGSFRYDGSLSDPIICLTLAGTTIPLSDGVRFYPKVEETAPQDDTSLDSMRLETGVCLFAHRTGTKK